MKAQQKVASVAAAALMMAGFITAAPSAQASPGHPIECPRGWVPAPEGRNPQLGPCVPGSIVAPPPEGPRVMLKAEPSRMAELTDA